jgi:regulatory protein spx
MLKIYTVQACRSCKRAKEWFKMRGLTYEEINLITNSITRQELLLLLSLTEEGVEEIISKRSDAYQILDINFDKLYFEELLELIIQYPTLLRRPLITDGKKLQVGYNEDDIRKFLSRTARRITLDMLTENISEDSVLPQTKPHNDNIKYVLPF